MLLLMKPESHSSAADYEWLQFPPRLASRSKIPGLNPVNCLLMHCYSLFLDPSVFLLQTQLSSSLLRSLRFAIHPAQTTSATDALPSHSAYSRMMPFEGECIFSGLCFFFPMVETDPTAVRTAVSPRTTPSGPHLPRDASSTMSHETRFLRPRLPPLRSPGQQTRPSMSARP